MYQSGDADEEQPVATVSSYVDACHQCFSFWNEYKLRITTKPLRKALIPGQVDRLVIGSAPGNRLKGAYFEKIDAPKMADRCKWF